MSKIHRHLIGVNVAVTGRVAGLAPAVTGAASSASTTAWPSTSTPVDRRLHRGNRSSPTDALHPRRGPRQPVRESLL